MLGPKLTVENVDGNHIVENIGGGVCAFYAHLQKGSLLVKPGDKVKKGDKIAKLGNTGNSNASHMHFHLMNGPSVLGSDGLPVRDRPVHATGGQVAPETILAADDFLSGRYFSTAAPCRPAPQTTAAACAGHRRLADIVTAIGHARHGIGRRVGRGVAVALLVVLVCSPATAYGSEGRRPTRADDTLDRAIQRFVTGPGHAPGIAVVVQRGDQRVFHAAGVANVATGATPKIHDSMRLASVAKAFSGAAARSSIRNGDLSLRDTIGQRLPQLPRAWAHVTLAQLLGHTSGIPDFSKSEAFGEALRASLLDPPPPVQLLSYVKDDGLLFTPGSRYQYSNSDNIIVGLMIEAATGRRYEAVLEARRVPAVRPHPHEPAARLRRSPAR